MESLEVARSDMQDAVLFCEITETEGHPPSGAWLQALTIAVAVTYSKPFKPRKGYERVPDYLCDIQSPAHRANHELLLRLRDKAFAHSDRQHVRVTFPPKAVCGTADFGGQVWKVAGISAIVERPYIAVESFPVIKELCRIHLDRWIAAIDRLNGRLGEQA